MGNEKTDKKQKVLVVLPVQYGYLTDHRKYIEALASVYDVIVVSKQTDTVLYESGGLKVIYLPSEGMRFRKDVYAAIERLIAENRFKFIFVGYFIGSSLLRMKMPKQKMMLDIRTVEVSGSHFRRDLRNLILSLESRLFTRVSAISKGVKRQLHLPSSTYILPLGADVCNITKNKIDKSPLRLIYVGTFNGRRLYDTIAGLALFLRKHPVTVSYQIIGRGNDEEELKLKESIEQFGLQDSVSLLGYVRNDELSHYCLSSHIGVSYVPITTAYDNQPPTKTFEYWGFGLPVIATATTAHRDIVTSQNGLLVQDTPASFAEGLEQIVVNLDTFDERIIKNSFKQYTWTVINKNFLDYVKEI